MNSLYAQFIGAAALLTICFSVQCRKKKNMMILQTIANILYSLQYILLNAFVAGIMNVFVVLRCLIFYGYDKKNKKVPIILPIIIVICVLITGYFTYSGYLSLIPIGITIAYTIGASYKDPKIFKKVFLICAFIWMIFNFLVGAYVCVFGNICEVVSTSIALKREKAIKKSNK